MTSATTVERASGQLTFTRQFAAPRTLVFRALSEADLLRRWWGPPAFPVVECSVDFRPGGVWHYCLRGADGSEVWARSVYRQIDAPRLVTYLERSSDALGSVTDERPAAFVTITLGETAEGTTLTARMQYRSPLDASRAIQAGVENEFSAALGLLDALLASIGDARPAPSPSPAPGA